MENSNFSLGVAPKVAKVKNGSYTVELVSATDPKEVVDRNGAKHPRCMFLFHVVGGKFNGEELTYWTNLDVNLTSDKSNLSKMVAALLGRQPTTKRLDLKDILGKQCNVMVAVAEKDGNTYSNIAGFFVADDEENDEPAAPAKSAPAPAPEKAGMTAPEFTSWLKTIGVAPETIAKYFGKPTWEVLAVEIYKAGNKDPRRELLKRYISHHGDGIGWAWDDKTNLPVELPF